VLCLCEEYKKKRARVRFPEYTIPRTLWLFFCESERKTEGGGNLPRKKDRVMGVEDTPEKDTNTKRKAATQKRKSAQAQKKREKEKQSEKREEPLGSPHQEDGISPSADEGEDFLSSLDPQWEEPSDSSYHKKDEKAFKLSEKLAKQAKEEDIHQMEEKLPHMKKGPIASIWDKVIALYKGFMSKDTPPAMKVFILGALLYLVLPLDVVPDAIPGVGLLDDATVILFAWKKFMKVTKALIGPDANGQPKLRGDFIKSAQEKVEKGYLKAFEIARKELDKMIKKQAKKTLLNCIINLGIFFIALLLLSVQTELSILLSSLCLLVTFLRSAYSFIKSIPSILSFLRAFIKTKNVDKTVALFLKEKYPFIEKIEETKNKFYVLSGIPDLDLMVKMERKALKTTLIEVLVSLSLAFGLAWMLRHILLTSLTGYTFWSLILVPFTRLMTLLG